MDTYMVERYLPGMGQEELHAAMGRLKAAAAQLQAEGVAVVRATRCSQGRILPRQTEVLRDAGALTPVKARIALMLELLSGEWPA